jgi:glucose repression mediator protein
MYASSFSLFAISSAHHSLLLQEPKLWYGIGILYDRYGSLEHAEEAFSSVIRMDPSAFSSISFFFHFLTSPFSTDFEKSNEIFFRLGIIYKQQRKSAQSLEVCFSLPPVRLIEAH